MSVVTAQVTGTSHTYWAYSPNPPINIGVSWRNMDILVIGNEFSWLPGPYDNQEPAKPMDEGKKIINYSVGVQGIPISMGIGIQSLDITFHVLLSADDSTQDYHNKLYVLHTSAFRGQEIDATSSKNLPFCKYQLPTRHLTGHIGNTVRVRHPELLLISLMETSMIAACKASLKENILTQN